MFKKINLESKGYKAFRSVVGVISGTGAGLTFECMSIPMVCGVLRNNRVLRLICYTGIVPIATIIDLMGKGAAESIVDSFAETYNHIIDSRSAKPDYVDVYPEPEVEIEVHHKYMGIDIPGKDATPEEEKKFVDDVILKTTAFEFATEESAKEFAASMFSALQFFGFLELTSVFKWFKVDLPTEVSDILYKYGWTKDDISSISVEKTKEYTWVVDVFNYHDISNVYEILYKGDE